MKNLLAIDIGNTTIALGVFSGDKLIESWHLASKVMRTMDEAWVMISQMLHSREIVPSSIEKVGISSVVPDLTFVYSNLSRDKIGTAPVIISASNVKGLKVSYDPPESVGADRLCGAYAGFTKYGGPLIAIDLGTATVFDVVSAEGVYLGGVIAPGLITAVDSLHHAAAQLPKVELQFPERVIGRSTMTSIQAGVLYGAIEMIDGIVDRIQKELPAKAVVVATGGFAKILKPRSRTLQHHEPDLVLEGIRMIVDQQ